MTLYIGKITLIIIKTAGIPDTTQIDPRDKIWKANALEVSIDTYSSKSCFHWILS